MSAYDAALWAAADRHMSEGIGPEGVGVVIIQRAWLGLPHVELHVEAEVSEATGVIVEARVCPYPDVNALVLRLAQSLAARGVDALHVTLTADEMADLALEVAEHAREQAEADRDYWAESRER